MTDQSTTTRPQHRGNGWRALGAGFWIALLLLLWAPWVAADTGPQRVSQYATTVPGELQHPGTVGSPFLVDLLAFVTDADGDTLQVTPGSVQVITGQGSVVDHGDGTVTYTAPSATYTGTAAITFQAEEARRPNPVTFTLLLSVDLDAPPPPPPPPSPPGAPTGLTATETAGTSGPEVALQWTATSTDQTSFRVYRAEGAGSFSLLAEPVAAQLTDAAVGTGSSYSYYVTAVNDVGESGASNTAQITLAPPPSERSAPVANHDGPFEVRRGETLTIDYATLTANDTDADVADPATGLEIVSYESIYTQGVLMAVPSAAPTAFRYTPPSGYAGPDTFTYEVRDPGDPPEIPSSTTSVSITVRSHAPVALDKGPIRTRPGTPFVLKFDRLLEGASDPGDSPPDTPLTVVGCNATGSQGSTIVTDTSNENDKKCIYTPAPSAAGSETFKYTIADSTGETADATVSIFVGPPIDANDDGPFTVAQAAELLIDPAELLANDTPGVEFLGPASQPAHGTVTWEIAVGKLRYVSDSCWAGPDSFEYAITDGGPEERGTVLIDVTGNRCPVAADDSYQLTQPGPTLTEPGSWVLDVLSNDQDPEQDPLTITHAGGVTQPGAVVELVNGTAVRYRAPSDSFAGHDQFVYYVSDGHHEASATVDLTISTPGNQPPQGYAERVTVPYQGYRNVTYGALLSNDHDPDGDTLSITNVTWGPALNMSCSDVSKSCTITGGPGQVGYWDFSYVVSDGRGGTATVTSRAAIGRTNNAPVALPDTLETPRDVPLDFFPNSALGWNDSDPDGDAITVGAVVAVAGTVGTVSCTQPPVRCTYTPPTGFVGTDTLSYTSTDGELSGWGSVTIQVTPSSNPIAYDDSATVSHPNTVTIPVLANDLDPEGGALTIQTPLSQPAHGTVTLAPDGKQIVYTPNASFIGQDSFQYTVVDPAGLTGTGTVTVRVKYNDGTLVPLADQLFVHQNETRSFYLSYLTTDDWDPDGDPLEVVSVAKKYASAGTLTCDYGLSSCTYTPPLNAWNVEELEYTVTNGSVSKTADLTIYIGKTGEPPAPVDDAFTVSTGSRLWFWASGLVANDVDPEGDGLQVLSVWGASHGTLDCYGNIYKCRYTPDAGYTGPDTLTYRVTDDLHAPVDASIQIEVLP